MAFRNIIINERCKLEYSLNYLICRRGNKEKRVLLDEIKTVVIDTTQVSITTSLLVMLSKSKIKILLCDECHNPEAELVPYINNYYSYRKIKEQFSLVEKGQGVLWKNIIIEKIKNQANNLQLFHKDEAYNLLNSYINEIEENDISNREGHAAKVYFNALFGNSFSRNDNSIINKFLNYGYAILASAISREIKAQGYLTELGIHHIGESNTFNFTYDIIEPLRPLVDLYVLKEIVNEDNYKVKFVEMLSIEVIYNEQNIILDNAIHLYVLDIINFMKNKEKITFIKYEL